MSLRSLVRGALGPDAGSDLYPDVRIHDIVADSRRVGPGALFVALPGTKADGSAYIVDALARGAVAIVCEARAADTSTAPVVRVPDTRFALARLAAVFFGLDRLQKEGELTAIGITGTNGKSTTAYMIRSMLRASGRQAGLLGTIEYDLIGRRLGADLTTPDCVTLARHFVEAYRAGARHVVMEVSSHSLEQRRCDGIAFQAAVFTNLTQDHLDYHGTLDSYLMAKRRLFEGLSPDASALVNADDPASARIVEATAARVMRYGLSNNADLRAEIVSEGMNGTRFACRIPGGNTIDVHTPLIGRHNVYNALAAASVGLSLKLDAGGIQRGLADLRHVPGRLQRVETGELGFDVFVDYAHTDDALRNVLSAARPLTRGRLWCVFGCGGDRDRTKRPKMARAVAECADRFVITSDNPRTEDPLAIIREIEAGLTADAKGRGRTVPDRAEAIASAIDDLRSGDTLVIAGKGHEDYQIIGTTKIHFDDVEVATQAVQRRQGTRAAAGALTGAGWSPT